MLLRRSDSRHFDQEAFQNQPLFKKNNQKEVKKQESKISFKRFKKSHK